MITCLDALLLFLVGHKEQSGYDIRQVFQDTPVGLFSDSPGAIYPALARLELRGLLRSDSISGGRRKKVFARTAEGGQALLDYLREPVRAEDVKRRQAELDLRYVMIEVTLGETDAKIFVAACAEAFARELRGLEAFRDGAGQALGTAPLRSLDLGIRLIGTRLAWCREMIHKEGAIDEDIRNVGPDGRHPGLGAGAGR